MQIEGSFAAFNFVTLTLKHIRTFMELDSEKLMDRGENHLMSGHLRAFHFVDSDDSTTYYCSVQSSMKNVVHEVEVSQVPTNNHIVTLLKYCNLCEHFLLPFSCLSRRVIFV